MSAPLIRPTTEIRARIIAFDGGHHLMARMFDWSRPFRHEVRTHFLRVPPIAQDVAASRGSDRRAAARQAEAAWDRRRMRLDASLSPDPI